MKVQMMPSAYKGDEKNESDGVFKRMNRILKGNRQQGLPRPSTLRECEAVGGLLDPRR